MTTADNIHGHVVLRLVHEAVNPPTRAELNAQICRLFGPRVRFCTCAAVNLPTDELLEFLLSRGKLVERNGRLATDPARICGDDFGAQPHNG